MFQYFNNHPRGLLVKDCVKRAIALAACMDYTVVQRELNKHRVITHARAFNTDYNPHSYVENVLRAQKISFPARRGEKRMTGERFCEAYPHGRYILTMPGHWTTCLDGVIYDTWDPSKHIVYTAYKITPKVREPR